MEGIKHFVKKELDKQMKPLIKDIENTVNNNQKLMEQNILKLQEAVKDYVSKEVSRQIKSKL